MGFSRHISFSPSLIVSIIALVIAASGGAFAATAITTKSKHHKLAKKHPDASQD